MTRLIASFAALLLVSSVASAQNDGPVSNEMVLPKQVPMGAGGSNLGSAQLFAIVNGANGGILRGKGEGPINQRTAVGTYRVSFSRDISGCSYQATVGAANFVVETGFASVARMEGTTQSLIIRTFAPGGAPANRSFHVYVDC